jgi:hypothetical protein
MCQCVLLTFAHEKRLKIENKNTKWPPRADWAAMDSELFSTTCCLIFGLNIKLGHERILGQENKLSLGCKASSIINNVCQKM